RPNLTGIAEGDRSRLKNLLASNFQQPSVQAENSQKSSLQAGLQHRAPAPAAAPTAAQGVSAASAQAMVAAMANRFASSGAPQLLGIPQGGLEQATAKPLPTATPPLDRPAATRSTEEWRPAPLLCKRFNVMDPYKGKADRTVHMSRFKTDYLALPDTMAAGHDQLVQTEQGTESDAGASTERQQAALEKPIDLFKAIFENDDESSEDELESGAEAAPTSTRQQSAAAPTSSLADRIQASSATAAQDHQRHTNGQLPASQLNMQPLQQLPSSREVGSQIQQQLQPAAPVQPDGMTKHQSAAEQLVSRIRQSEDLGSRRSSKKKRKHREDDEEQPRKKKHKKEKDRKHSGRHKVKNKSRSAKLSTASAERDVASTCSESV
ncbi:MAG: G patch domain-containing 1-like, partial [Trebouxia sp. A1-2]